MSLADPAEVTDHVVVRAGASNSSSMRRLHVPAKDDPGVPACRVRHQPGVTWVRKDLSVYPPAWREWCGWCKGGDR